MDTTFLNVTITIKAKTPKQAYTKLCNLLAKGDPNIGWETDTYIVGNQNWEDGGSTEKLFPKVFPKRGKHERSNRNN